MSVIGHVTMEAGEGTEGGRGYFKSKGRKELSEEMRFEQVPGEVVHAGVRGESGRGRRNVQRSGGPRRAGVLQEQHWGPAAAGRRGLGQEEPVGHAKASHSILSVRKPSEVRVGEAGSPCVVGFFWRPKGAWTAGRGRRRSRDTLHKAEWSDRGGSKAREAAASSTSTAGRSNRAA